MASVTTPVASVMAPVALIATVRVEFAPEASMIFSVVALIAFAELLMDNRTDMRAYVVADMSLTPAASALAAAVSDH